MKKRYAILLVLIMVMVFILILFFFKIDKRETVCSKEKCFLVKIADEEHERQKGLMNVESLDEDEGMLFVFPESGVYNFWMKDTFIPLDIIWINERYEAVYIAESQQPCSKIDFCPSINPNANARYVLEINAGLSEKINLSVGDKLVFRLVDNQ